MIRRLIGGSILLYVLSWVTMASSDELVERQTNASLSAFYGFCLNELFDLARVKELSERLNWKAISSEDLDIFVPKIEAEIIEYNGYMFLSPDDSKVPLMAFTGQSVDPEGQTVHCSMFFNDVLPSEFIDGFVKDTAGELLDVKRKAAGTIQIYNVPEFSGDVVLIEFQPRSRGLRATFLMREVAHAR